MADTNIFEQSDTPNPFLATPEADKQAVDESLAKQEAAFLGIMKGETGSTAQFNAAVTEQQIIQSGGSAALNEYKTQALEQLKLAKQQRVQSVVQANTEVSQKISQLSEIAAQKEPRSMADIAIRTAKELDATYVNGINAIEARYRNGGKIADETVSRDPYFATAAADVYKKVEGKPFKGSQLEATEWGKDFVRKQFDTTRAVRTALMLKDDAHTALAYGYLNTVMDYKEGTYGGAVYDLAQGVSDPTVIGLTLLTGLGGIGESLASKGLISLAVKETLVTASKSIASKSAVLGIGASYGTAQSLSSQQLKVSAGLQDGIDPLEVAETAAVSAVLAGTIDWAAPKVSKQLGKIFTSKSAAEKLRAASPSSGRSITVDNMVNGNPLAGESPEASFAAMNAVDPMDAKAGPGYLDTVQQIAVERPVVSYAATDAEIAKTKELSEASLVKGFTSPNMVIRVDKNGPTLRTTIDGDLVLSQVTLGKSQEEGWGSLGEVAAHIDNLIQTNDSQFAYQIMSKQANGDIRQMTTEEASGIRAMELFGDKDPTKPVVSGEYFLRIRTQSLINEEANTAGKWIATKGMSGLLGRLLGHAAQQGPEFAKPFFAAKNLAVSLKTQLEDGLQAMRALPLNKQITLSKALSEGENGKVLTALEAEAKFGDSKMVAAYQGFKNWGDTLHRVFDYTETKLAQLKGFRQHEVTAPGSEVRTLSGAAKEVDREFLRGSSEFIGQDGKFVKLTNAEIDKHFADGGKALLLRTPKSEGLAASNILLVSKEATHTSSVLSSTLNKVAGIYIPGTRKAAYIIHKNVDGFTMNGTLVKGSEFMGTEDGQRALTVGFANSKHDAEQAILVLQKENPDLRFSYTLSKEAGGIPPHMEAGYSANVKGLVYGARSKLELQTVMGAGELGDIMSSAEAMSSRAASMMTEDRVLNFYKQRWTNTFAPRGGSFPESRIEALKMRSGAAEGAGTEAYARETKIAMDGWDAIDTQKKFYDSQTSRYFRDAAIKVEQKLSDLATYFDGKGGTAYVARLLGKHVANKTSITQRLRQASYYTQVGFSLAQLPNNLAQAATTTTAALAGGPKVMIRAMHDIYKLSSGEHPELSKELAKYSNIGSISEHEIMAQTVATSSREDLNNMGFLRASANIAGHSIKSSLDVVPLATVRIPEKLVRIGAFITARQLKMQEYGVTSTKNFIEQDFMDIAAMANTLSGNMDSSGKMQASTIPGLDLIMQYKALPIKMASILVSGIPGLSETGFAQKVIPKRIAQRMVLLAIGMYGINGVGGGDTAEAIRQAEGWAYDNEAYKFLKEGIVGFTINKAAQNLIDNPENDPEADIAFSERYSTFSSMGVDSMIHTADLVTGNTIGTIDPAKALANFPAGSLVGNMYTAASHIKDMFIDLSPDDISLKDKTWAAAQEMMRVTSLGSSAVRARRAMVTGEMYDKQGNEGIPVTKSEAIAIAFGARTGAEIAIQRLQHQMAKEDGKSGSYSQSTIKQEARDLYDRYMYQLNNSYLNGHTVEETGIQLKAVNLIMGMSYPPNQRDQIKQEFYKLINNNPENKDRVEKMQDLINRMVLTPTISIKVEAIKSIPNRYITEEQRNFLIERLNAAQEAFPE